jgi:hypothetical protein
MLKQAVCSQTSHFCERSQPPIVVIGSMCVCVEVCSWIIIQPWYVVNVREIGRMSLRPTADSAAPATRAPSRLHGVMQAGLSLGAKFVDGDGKTVRYVEFEPNDPKETYKRTCVFVPWRMFSSRSRVQGYVNDVSADPRIKEIRPTWEFTESTVQSEKVQNYANDLNNSRPVKISFSEVLWVMSWNEDSFRFCLVPIDSMSLDERLKEAIHFLKTYLSDEALTTWRRRIEARSPMDQFLPPIEPKKDQASAYFRDFYVKMFEDLLAVLPAGKTELFVDA